MKMLDTVRVKIDTRKITESSSVGQWFSRGNIIRLRKLPNLRDFPHSRRSLLNLFIRVINHEYLHIILFDLEGDQACTDLDNFMARSWL